MTEKQPKWTRRETLRTGAVLSGLALGGSAISTGVLAQPEKGAESSGKYLLWGTAEVINEPDVRPTNQVVSIDTSDDGLFGNVGRYLGVKASELDDHLSFDYYIASGDCGGGSPRLVLSIDDDGDGEHDFYLVTDGAGSPGWASCPGADENWVSFDATDDGDTYWRKHPGGPFATWSDAKDLLSSDHVVLAGALVDDSYWKASTAGVAYYDNVTIGDLMLTGNGQIVGTSEKMLEFDYQAVDATNVYDADSPTVRLDNHNPLPAMIKIASTGSLDGQTFTVGAHQASYDPPEGKYVDATCGEVITGLWSKRPQDESWTEVDFGTATVGGQGCD